MKGDQMGILCRAHATVKKFTYLYLAVFFMWCSTGWYRTTLWGNLPSPYSRYTYETAAFTESSVPNYQTTRYHILKQGCTIVQKSTCLFKILDARRVVWSKFQNEDPQNIRRHRTKFRRQGYLAPGFCAPLS
jgi:hypothetical protein